MINTFKSSACLHVVGVVRTRRKRRKIYESFTTFFEDRRRYVHHFCNGPGLNHTG